MLDFRWSQARSDCSDSGIPHCTVQKITSRIISDKLSIEEEMDVVRL